MQHLRRYEEVLLYNNLLQVTGQEQQEAALYLAEEHRKESVAYPFVAPAFSEPAALWAARTVYAAVQLMLHREHAGTELAALLPAYSGTADAAALLSADLLLRFLPAVIDQLKAWNPDDPLVVVLEEHLKKMHYSGIAYPLPVQELIMEVVVSDPCLYQLYIDRVIRYKRLPLANHPLLNRGIHASLGMFGAVYWNDFQQQVIDKK